MIKRVVEVINLPNGAEDIGTVTNMYDCNADETTCVENAVQLVIKYGDKGYMNVDATRIDIYTVH